MLGKKSNRSGEKKAAHKKRTRGVRHVKDLTIISKKERKNMKKLRTLTQAEGQRAINEGLESGKKQQRKKGLKPIKEKRQEET